MQHTATYYDGQTSLPHEAQVEVFGNSLRIFYESGTGIIWAISEIEFSSFSGRGKTMLQYGTFPHQYLEFPVESTLTHALKGYLPERGGKLENMAREYNTIIKGAFILLAVLSAIVAVLYFVLLPVIASFIVGKIPVATEVALGEKFYASFVGNAKVDASATKALNNFARNIDFETTYPLKFTVVENKEVNAFALPGGNVVVFSGILDRIKSPEELAALLAHEVTHIKERHSLKGLTRNLAGSMLISLVFGDAGSLGNVLINRADDIYQLGFSRSMEKEADLEGLQIMAHNRVDTQGMLGLMQRLQEEEKKHNVSSVSSYLNSHPMTEERIAYIKENSTNNSGIHNNALYNAWRQIK